LPPFYERKYTNNELEYKANDSNIERKIGIIIIIIQFILSVSIESIYLIVSWIKFHQFNFINILIAFLIPSLIINIQFTFLSLIAYQSCCVAVKLKEITDNFSTLNEFNRKFHEILNIHELVQKFDSFIYDQNMILLIVNTVNCISYSCLLYIEFNNSLEIAFGGFCESISIILILCLISDTIPRAFNKFIMKFELLEREYSDCNRNVCNNYYSIDYSLINRMYYMRDELCFTAFNLYK